MLRLELQNLFKEFIITPAITSYPYIRGWRTLELVLDSNPQPLD